MKQTRILSQTLPANILRCQVCQRHCRLSPGQTGFCLTKLNRGGKLVDLTYGLLSGPPTADPVEKKPLYHFLPGTRTLSLGSFGCNYRCRQCLNHPISWGSPATQTLRQLATQKTLPSPSLSPTKIVSLCRQHHLPSLAFTYNEPTLWAPFIFKVARLAHRQKIKTIFVTNGSWSHQTLDLLGPHLDAANIDFKGFSPETYRRQGAFWGRLLPLAKLARKKYHLHLEITTLLIPGINDQPEELKKMTAWIAADLGPETPWHLSAYSPELSPDPEFQKIPAPTARQLHQAVKIGQKEGLQFIYLWAPALNLQQGDTFCPHCHQLVIRRQGWQPELLGITPNGHCQNCGQDLNLVLS